MDNWDKATGFKWIEFSGADHIIPYELSLHHCLNGKEVVIIVVIIVVIR